MARPDWLILQIADSAFPAGAIAHSGGLESAWRLGFIRDATELNAYVRNQLQATARGPAVYVAAAYRTPSRTAEFDAELDALLNNHVACRASRLQGQAMFLACRRIFPQNVFAEWAAPSRDAPAVHLPNVFGAMCRCLEIELRECVRLYLYLMLRTLVSAAVRLGLAGPLVAQSMQWRLSTYGESFIEAICAAALADVVQTAPLLDLLQGGQDRLYSRLFQS